MNILPFLLSLLIVIALAASRLGNSETLTHIKKKSYLGLIHAVSTYHEIQVKTTFKRIKDTNINESGRDGPSSGTNKKKRGWICRNESQKFSLAQLLEKSPPPVPMYESAARLLKSMYKSAPFYRDKLEYELLDLILKEKAKIFSKLLPKEHPLHETFYLAMTGTATFSLEKEQGYPPLLAFFTLEERSSKIGSVYFHNASLPVLHAICGKELVETVLAAEEKKGQLLDEPEITTLLDKKIELKELFNFQARPKKKVTEFSDELTRIQVKEPSLELSEEDDEDEESD
jgi:hypothetical protein